MIPTQFSFPSIEQFRNVVKDVTARTRYVGKDTNGDAIYDPFKPLPKLLFSGTVKLHGTNAAICQHQDTIWCQSRENVITVEKDNAGFAFFVTSLGDKIPAIFDQVKQCAIASGDYFAHVTDADVIAIYGEWCGGNIQKGVALNGLEKMFVIFKIKIIRNGDPADCEWLPLGLVKTVSDPENRIHNIYDFPSFMQVIDFNHPELVQNDLGSLTKAVEDECPVGKAFGSIGTGEGIVWTAVADHSSSGIPLDGLVFKVKGEKHSASKVKTLASVDIEKVNNIIEFVDSVVTESRLNQGLDHLRLNGLEIDVKNTGPFLKWIANDVFKEEMDTMVANGLEPKEVGGAISKAARPWFMNAAMSNI